MKKLSWQTSLTSPAIDISFDEGNPKGVRRAAAVQYCSLSRIKEK
jgi:hypothetical protein